MSQSLISSSLATMAYVGAAILFILSLGGLSNPETSRRGNLYGIVGMALAVLVTIVVLGGGKYYNAPEYTSADTVSEPTLVRLRYAAWLHRQTGKPILVSGGSPEGSSVSEGQAMKAVLENEFKVPVAWTEDKSFNTFENAHASRASAEMARTHARPLVPARCSALMRRPPCRARGPGVERGAIDGAG